MHSAYTSFLICLPLHRRKILESLCLSVGDMEEQKIYVVQMHSMLIDSSTGCNILLEHKKKGTVADLGNGMQRPHFSSLFNRIVSRKPM